MREFRVLSKGSELQAWLVTCLDAALCFAAGRSRPLLDVTADCPLSLQIRRRIVAFENCESRAPVSCRALELQSKQAIQS